MNKKKFDDLKPEFQKALLDAANEAGNYYMDLGAKSVNEDLEKMKKEHGIEYIVLDTKPCAEKMQPVIHQLEKEGFIPAGLYDRIQALEVIHRSFLRGAGVCAPVSRNPEIGM